MTGCSMAPILRDPPRDNPIKSSSDVTRLNFHLLIKVRAACHDSWASPARLQWGLDVKHGEGKLSLTNTPWPFSRWVKQAGDCPTLQAPVRPCKSLPDISSSVNSASARSNLHIETPCPLTRPLRRLLPTSGRSSLSSPMETGCP